MTAAIPEPETIGRELTVFRCRVFGAAISSAAPRHNGRGAWVAVRPLAACCVTRSGRACRPRLRSGGHRPAPGTKDRRGSRTCIPARLRWSCSTPRRCRGRRPGGGSRGVLAAALVVGNQLDLDVERQGAKRAGEAVFVCGEGADVGHNDFSFRLNKVRAHRVLVVIRPAGTGWLHRLRSKRSGEPGGEKNLLREEAAQRGNCFRRTVAAMKPEAQPRPARIHNETRTPWAEPLRKEMGPTRHPRPKASPARPLTRARSTRNDRRECPRHTLRRRS